MDNNIKKIINCSLFARLQEAIRKNISIDISTYKYSLKTSVKGVILSIKDSGSNIVLDKKLFNTNYIDFLKLAI